MSILYDIAISLLQDEPDAHLVLADCLEEQDDPWLAARARRMEAKAAERIGIALGTLPHLTAVRLGCNFFEHFLESRPDVYEYPYQIRDSVERVRRWTTRASGGEKILFGEYIASSSDVNFYHAPLYGARSLVGAAYECLYEAVITCRQAVRLRLLAQVDELYTLRCGMRANLHQLIAHLHQESAIIVNFRHLGFETSDGREIMRRLKEMATAPCQKEVDWQNNRLTRQFEKLSIAH